MATAHVSFAKVGPKDQRFPAYKGDAVTAELLAAGAQSTTAISTPGQYARISAIGGDIYVSTEAATETNSHFVPAGTVIDIAMDAGTTIHKADV